MSHMYSLHNDRNSDWAVSVFIYYITDYNSDSVVSVYYCVTDHNSDGLIYIIIDYFQTG